MNRKFPLLLSLLSICFFVGEAYSHTFTQTFYVRPPGQYYGNGDGSSWANAFSDLPETLTRGAVYYLASGNYDVEAVSQYYVWHKFDDPELSRDYIGIYKATANDHGDNNGWLESMGEGPAVLGPVEFVTGYYIIDGKVGKKNKGHGIKIATRDCANGEAKNVRFPWNSTSSYVELRHMDIGHCGSTGFTLSQDNIYGNVVGDHILHHITISNCFIHDANRAHLVILDATDILIEQSYFARSGQHQETTSLAPRNVTNFTVRDSVFKDTTNNFIDFRTVTNIHIYSNVFIGSLEGWEIYSAIESFSPAENIFIYNNTFYNLKGLNVGIRLGAGTYTNAQVYNNLWASNRANQIMLTGTHDYNAFFDNWRLDENGDKLHKLDERIVEDHVQVITKNPFINGPEGDFHPVSATETGIPLVPPFNIDPDGKKRGRDGGWDRGAYEYVSFSAVTGPIFLLLK